MTGSPGVGKTRLALQVASDLRDDFRQGVFFVRLAPVADPELLPATILSAFGIPPTPGQALTELLANYLRDKQLLLLLDNCEHLLAGTPLITELLQQCAALCVLATSREPLRLYGEQRFAVPPLALPPSAQLPCLSPAELLDYSAVALFAERAHAVQFDFTFDHVTVPVIAGICQQLDGLPLAIELAAAQVSTLPLPAILARLASRLELLVEGTRDAPDRHQTFQCAGL